MHFYLVHNGSAKVIMWSACGWITEHIFDKISFLRASSNNISRNSKIQKPDENYIDPEFIL